MRQYAGVHALFMSFFSPRLYRDVAAHWRGTGFLYLLLLLALSWVPVMVKVQLASRRFAASELPRVSRDFPAIDLRAGRASSPVQQPYTMRDPATGRPLLVLDTSGTITSLDTTRAPFLLTADTLHFHDQWRGARKVPLRYLPDVSLTGEKLEGWMEAFAPWIGIALYPVALLASLLVRILVAALLALLALAIGLALRRGITYRAGLRLACVAMTPAILVSTLVTSLSISVPYWPQAALGITVLYLLLAVVSARAAAPAA
jgi:hypothetical protein